MRLTTRFLMACAAIGAATGILLLPANFAAAAISAALPMVYAAMVGLWLVGPVVALAVLRRPGAGVLTMLIAGIINIPTPAGPTAIVTNLMVGVALELGFLVTLYRIWRPWLFYVTALAFETWYAISAYAFFDIDDMAVPVQAVFFALMAASAVVFTWLGLVVARRLAATGVARGIAVAGR
ncbi:MULTISPECIES: ECF transporter S component [Catenuloplanes]|uniref:Energy-coupling factor transport system substrate-specific component n=1 Tax=Catenuloplanes niger TaxID=587534 RepID=A0AAE4CSH8_9ACTN|nr:ECF transporter S component [Catenuloplanes niger]MDR7322392.1 energy-coupling factor transport system substrate-specific component [Catenuloplanes niger]